MRIPFNLSQKIPFEALKYLISGGMGAVVQILLTSFLVKHFFWSDSAAVVSAFIVSLCLSFLLQHFWTFAEREKANNLRVMTFWYTVISLLGVGLNIVFLHFFRQLLHLPIMPADALAVSIVALINYVLNSKITFRERTL
jgi:putative flippase GtrA